LTIVPATTTIFPTPSSIKEEEEDSARKEEEEGVLPHKVENQFPTTIKVMTTTMKTTSSLEEMKRRKSRLWTTQLSRRRTKRTLV
jgi:hypothetical protein